MLKNILKKWYISLPIVTGIALILRLLPAWLNPAWGCDFGIYYGLTNAFVQTGELFNDYTGWGDSYQYFPILYSITGIIHWITNIDIIVLMPKIAPIFGGLSVFVFYFVAYGLLNDQKKALLASLFLAVLPFHVYQTSHASPLTFGHFFMTLCLLFFIKFRKKQIYIVPLMISTILLIMSHHLTTYFYLISLIGIVFMENFMIRQWTYSIRKDIFYIAVASCCIFSYWMLIATPVYHSFMRLELSLGGISFHSFWLIILFYLGWILLFISIIVKRRLNLFKEKKALTAQQAAFRVIATLSVSITAMLFFTFTKMPWTNFAFTPVSLIYALPLILVVGFGVAGFRATRFIQHGYFIRGWLCAILVSLFYGIVTNSTLLYPDRHFEYLMVPLSIIAVYGINTVFMSTETSSKSNQKHMKKTFSFKKVFHSSFLTTKRKGMYIAVILLLVSANAVSVYPGFESLNAADETITYQDLAALDWMSNNLCQNITVIASDHRLARLAEASGFATTNDDAYLLWICVNLSEYIDELCATGKNYSQITHILIDDIMKDKVVHVGHGDIYYMTNASYEKFSAEPFERIYRNESSDTVPNRWVEVYAVNWTWIHQQYQI